jgi:hypothetical protein
MAKFGLYGDKGRVPIQRYEGDRMIWESGKEYVQIVAGDVDRGTARTVAVIRLERGQSVKEMAENAAVIS